MFYLFFFSGFEDIAKFEYNIGSFPVTSKSDALICNSALQDSEKSDVIAVVKVNFEERCVIISRVPSHSQSCLSLNMQFCKIYYFCLPVFKRTFYGIPLSVC